MIASVYSCLALSAQACLGGLSWDEFRKEMK